MNRTRKLTMAVSVVAVAAGMGHLMQGAEAGRPDSARVAPASAVPLVPVPVDVAQANGAEVEGAALPVAAVEAEAAEPAADTRLAAVDPAPGPVPVSPRADDPGLTGQAADAPAAVPADAPVAPPVASPAAPAPVVAEAPACTQTLEALAQPGAMVQLVLSAPCRADARVVLRLDGLAVTARTTRLGTLTAELPAFRSPSALSALFDDGTRIEAVVQVDDIAGYDRYAVQWFGDEALALHAYVGEAAFGDPGHISAETPRRPGSAGTFLSVLGDASVDRPLRAQVFTWPAGIGAATGTIRLDLEAAVTAASCGRDVLGETVERIGGAVRTRELTLPLPECDGTDGFVVLQNPFEDLKLASD